MSGSSSLERTNSSPSRRRENEEELVDKEVENKTPTDPLTVVAPLKPSVVPGAEKPRRRSQEERRRWRRALEKRRTKRREERLGKGSDSSTDSDIRKREAGIVKYVIEPDSDDPWGPSEEETEEGEKNSRREDLENKAGGSRSRGGDLENIDQEDEFEDLSEEDPEIVYVSAEEAKVDDKFRDWRFTIPESLNLRLADSNEAKKLVNDHVGVIYGQMFKHGLAYPFHPIFVEFMEHYNLHPAQIHSNTIVNMNALICWCSEEGVEATFELFRGLFTVNYYYGIASVRPRFGKPFHFPTNSAGWKGDTYLFDRRICQVPGWNSNLVNEKKNEFTPSRANMKLIDRLLSKEFHLERQSYIFGNHSAGWEFPARCYEYLEKVQNRSLSNSSYLKINNFSGRITDEESSSITFVRKMKKGWRVIKLAPRRESEVEVGSSNHAEQLEGKGKKVASSKAIAVKGKKKVPSNVILSSSDESSGDKDNTKKPLARGKGKKVIGSEEAKTTAVPEKKKKKKPKKKNPEKDIPNLEEGCGGDFGKNFTAEGHL